MRLLVACPECQRQYDASSRRTGSRFRCHCGALVEVRQPEGHDAQVVRCSSCGAPRQENSRFCSYCHSDFTLHERDLNTVCPQCLARVSDSARFCHHCGIGLVPELNAGSESKLCCPACPDGQRLTSRRLGAQQVTVLECGACGGFWLGTEAFRQLADRAREHTVPPLTPVGLAPRQVAGVDDPNMPRRASFYKPCVVCGQLMNRLNYGHTSGVIVNFCKDHGIWFDADELARILAWLRDGGSAAVITGGQHELLPGHAALRPVERRGFAAEGGDEPLHSNHSPLHSLLNFLGDLFGGSFR